MTVTRIFDVVNDYGADPTGATNSTTAINNAIAAAKAMYSQGATITYPPGNYSVDSINSTGFNGVRHIGLGGPSSVRINGGYQSTPAALMDCTGSSAVIIENLVFTGGASESSPPLAGILFAATTQNADSNANRVDNCGSTGYFGSAPLCIIGSPCNQYYSSRFQQEHSQRPVIIVSTNPDWYITSKYKTITSNGATNVGKNIFFGCEFHGKHATSAHSYDCWTIYGRNIDSLVFHGCLIDSASNGTGFNARAHILLQGTGNNNLAFFGSSFYTESGFQAVNLMQVDNALGKFITHGCTEIAAYSGARLTGVAPTTVSNI